MPTSYLRAQDLPTQNAYSIMKVDRAIGDGDGVLHREQLGALVHHLEHEVNRLEDLHSVRDEDLGYFVDARSLLGTARELLQDLDAKGARGLVYLPDALLAQFAEHADGFIGEGADLAALAHRVPEHLRRRASELLLLDDVDRFGQITPDVIMRGMARYQAMELRVSVNTIRSRDLALKEIAELARILGLQEAVHG